MGVRHPPVHTHVFFLCLPLECPRFLLILREASGALDLNFQAKNYARLQSSLMCLMDSCVFQLEKPVFLYLSGFQFGHQEWIVRSADSVQDCKIVLAEPLTE